MRRLLFLCMIMCLSSCSLFKKNTKNKLVDNTETTISSHSKTAEIIADKSKITITEKADTSAYTKPQQTTGTNKIGLHIDSLVNGLTAISNDLLDVKMVLDSNGVLTTTAFIKPQIVALKFDRNTQIDKDVTGSKYAHVDQQVTEKKDVKVVDSASEPSGLGMMGWICVVGIVCFFLWIGFKR
ncbi:MULTISPECIES: hypothetical protein [unclassified Pedobacter]|uniref:hypothetical protein n=1 Tax=unclassified Pedobacter TaxID=2628915 RepID=UPI00141DEC81|nr:MULTISPECIES: hypothetical protein [unclassified Pedobacter]NII81762.1 hypothetical protein [Pedobacter sp. SG908]NMN35764.1 hypothetical protein [Pedobacter sp. SG918]